MSDEIIFSRINHLLKLSNMQQKDLADAIHIKKQTFNGYLTGRRPFPLETIVAVADYFGVSVDYVLGRSEDGGPPITD